jgi:hypothetical protein
MWPAGFYRLVLWIALTPRNTSSMTETYRSVHCSILHSLLNMMESHITLLVDIVTRPFSRHFTSTRNEIFYILVTESLRFNVVCINLLYDEVVKIF